MTSHSSQREPVDLPEAVVTPLGVTPSTTFSEPQEPCPPLTAEQSAHPLVSTSTPLASEEALAESGPSAAELALEEFLRTESPVVEEEIETRTLTPTSSLGQAEREFKAGFITANVASNLERIIRASGDTNLLTKRPEDVASLIRLDTGSRKGYSKGSTLIRKTGYFIIPFEKQFHYVKISQPIRRSDQLFNFGIRRPTILRDGFVVIDKEVYYVSVDDLKRGIIRASHKVELKKGAVTYDDFLTGNYKPIRRAKPAFTPRRSSDGKFLKRNLGLSGGGPVSTQEIAAAIAESADLDGEIAEGLDADPSMDESEIIADLVRHQAQTLLDPLSEEEDVWQVAENPQP